MGAGASADAAEKIKGASAEELKAAYDALPAEKQAGVMAALGGKPADAKEVTKEEVPPPPAPFAFASGLPDCCSSNPESYTVVAEIPGQCRLVQMKMAAGAEDQLHEHPEHPMYFVTGAKLSITGYPDGKTPGEPNTVEIPAGAAPIMPAGAHQVKNIGDAEAIGIFVEPFSSFKPCGEVPKFCSAFSANPDCYKVQAENEDWFTCLLTIEPGATDKLHNHKDHVIYVLEGDEVTIYPDGDLEKGNVVPLKAFAGIPAPMSAGPMFANHCVKNSGSTVCKMLFFEMKR